MLGGSHLLAGFTHLQPPHSRTRQLSVLLAGRHCAIICTIISHTSLTQLAPGRWLLLSWHYTLSSDSLTRLAATRRTTTLSSYNNRQPSQPSKPRPAAAVPMPHPITHSTFNDTTTIAHTDTITAHHHIDGRCRAYSTTTTGRTEREVRTVYRCLVTLTPHPSAFRHSI